MSGENPVKTILVLSANPKGTKPLRLDEEIREIGQGLQRAKKRDSFEFKLGQAVRDFDIHRSILDYEPQIIHFSGHGTGESGLVFEDNIGQQKLIDAEALAGLFELFAEQIDCVVLNACYSEIQAKAIAKHIDYVIGMSQEIGDAAAIKFAVGFYDALGAGKDFEFAYKLGCGVIRMAGIPEHLTPQLLRKKDFCEEDIDITPVSTSTPQDARKTTIISPSPTTATTPLVPRQEETSIAKYRQQVEEFASDGVISDIESHILNDLQRKLGLTDEQTSEVREEVLEPYEIYKQQFNKKVAEQGYPLKEKSQAELNKLQNYYKIKDEYVSLLNKKAEKQETEKLPQQKQENNLQRYEQELSKALKAGYPLDNYVRNGLKSFQQFLGLRDEDIALIEERVLAPKQAEYERQQQESKKLSEEEEKNSANSTLFDKARGDDLRLDLKLDFREAIFGGEKEIRISHLETCEVCKGTGAKSGNKPLTCTTCNGSGKVDRVTKTPFGSFTQVVNCGSCKGTGKIIGEKCNSCNGKGRNQVTKKLKIEIPAGVDNGTRLRVSKEGDAGQFGGSPGDLYVYLFVNKDKEFERDGINILSEITISYQQALSGCRLETNTVDGLVEMIIPPKTQPNTVMKLKNRGVPRLGNPISRGDHLITVIVKI